MGKTNKQNKLTPNSKSQKGTTAGKKPKNKNAKKYKTNEPPVMENAGE